MILTHEQGSPVRTAQSLYIFDQSSKAIFVSNCNIDAKNENFERFKYALVIDQTGIEDRLGHYNLIRNSVLLPMTYCYLSRAS